MNNNSEIISKLSPHLFWDVKPEQLDAGENKAYIIKRVLEYGLWQDWLLLKNFYGLKTISDQSQRFRELDPKSLAFIAHLSGVPKEKFRCYITKQSSQKHWNF